MFVFGVLSLLVVLSEYLVEKTPLRFLGVSLLVIVLAAVTANLGIIPTSAAHAPVYDWVFSTIAPLAIFLILLKVNVKDVLKAGSPMILMFVIGAAGSVIGVLVGMKVIGGRRVIGDLWRAVGGMYTGTYIGGSVNFNAIALQYGVVKNGTLFAGATAVDNIITTIWMLVCLAFPRVMARIRPAESFAGNRASADILKMQDDAETLRPLDVGLLLAAGLFTIVFSNWFAGKWSIPSILILTSVALILAQFDAVQKLSGSRVMGMFALNVFLAVIGAFCDLGALRQIGTLGLWLLVLVTVIVGVHGILIFAAGIFLKMDHHVTAVASQACIGGPSSALAVARSTGREDLALPGILVGALGYAVGTYLGFWVTEFLLRP